MIPFYLFTKLRRRPLEDDALILSNFVPLAVMLTKWQKKEA